MANDTKVAKEQVSINFQDRAYVPPKYVFEMDDRTDVDQTLLGAVRIRKYPAYPPGSWNIIGTPLDFDQGIKTVVTEGQLYTTTEVRERECSGTAVLNGDAEFSLPYPVVHSLDFAIDGQMFDIRGREISVNCAFDSVKNAIVFSKPCYGVVRYSFITQYLILRYYPTIYNDIEIYYMPDPKDYGDLLGFIKVPVGLDPISPVVFSISPPQSLAAEFELYRVESAALANEKGLWEKPTGWPTNATYVGYPDQLDANGSYVEVARTHEIAYFSLTNNVRRMEGYQSTSSAALPLDYSKEMKWADDAGRTVKYGNNYTTTFADGSRVSQTLWNSKQVQNKEYFDKYRRLLNNAPPMRVVYYEVPVAEPYKSKSNINKVKGTVRVLSGVRTVVDDGKGDVTRKDQVASYVQGYRIKLVVKVPSRPSISSATLRNQSNNSSTDIDTQALRVNTMLSLIWEGVDWRLIRRRILASYDSDIYQVTFDSSFPSN